MHRRVTPSILAGSHLYTWVKRSSFNDDLKQSNLLSTSTFDLTGLIEKYENTLTETLERHAPLKRRVIVECVTCFVEFMNHKGCRVKKQKKHVLGVFE